MENGTIIVQPGLSLEYEPIDASFINFDFPNLIGQIKHSFSWGKGELCSMILMKEPEKQIVFVALQANTLIKSFQSNESISFQLVMGKLRFHSQKESVTLEVGQILTLFEKIKYNLSTKEESFLVFTIVKNNLETAVL